MNNLILQKTYIRTRIKHERQNLTSPFMQRAAIAILGHISQAKLIENHQHIAFYLPIGGEVSCMPIIEYALSQGKNCYIPKINTTKARTMDFLPYTGQDSVKKGAYGIYEPVGDATEAVAPSKLSLVFMPLVAFDSKGNRLGMGGGYYDTFFANLSKKKRPELVGLAYNFQKVPEIPTEKWDLAMDAVVTPNHFLRFSD
ncbi:5-formyltetrahydrofolate cyclo-ligase [Kangiella spongicola]|uniref:5-formyltetrahydrofolate cyclo-ligase n=1 Tax=Kangiella spongicola TaxID=796379 RepID=A0A318D5K4_9GAMM|nr:5-formyltetrahydrofolate cyclo-ligase [Kangiella spongicola]PXF64171.1 5-formyltetrahydrofolate cyclo-ligase [Kangiella spongicola]